MFYFNLNRFDLIILDFDSSFEGILKKNQSKGNKYKILKSHFDSYRVRSHYLKYERESPFYRKRLILRPTVFYSTDSSKRTTPGL